jgi:5-methyltetrahydropteroyltriglutamate--homocysteine methyltransferase
MEILDELATTGYGRGVGPGVYDIHSPRVPDQAEIAEALRAAAKAIDPVLLWANPDCGLKTRSYAEIEPALTAIVAAARQVRAELAR